MYTPKSFEINNLEQLHQFIEQFNFATLISHSNGDTQVTHLPVMLDRKSGPYGTLIGHMAKLNTHLKEFDGSKQALLIFHGPHAYISPAWYESSPSVPTWNYAVLHAYGAPEIVTKEQLAKDLTHMVNHHESQLEINPQYNIPEGYKLKMLDHIDGFKMEIKRIEGKFKLGQNRSAEDQTNMLRELRKQKSRDAKALADFIDFYANK